MASVLRVGDRAEHRQSMTALLAKAHRRPAAAIESQEHFVGMRHRIVAVSLSMRSVLDRVARIGPTQMTVLLMGETGTGKELVARALHATSDRRQRPFVAVNSGGIPDGLFESELFGHRKGAFTGAAADREGLLEAAHRGTLFLDEAAEMPLAMQIRLLRFLEESEVRRLGETGMRRVDGRVIGATNSAEDQVRKGTRRE